MKFQWAFLPFQCLAIAYALLLLIPAFPVWGRPQEPTIVFDVIENETRDIYTMDIEGKQISKLLDNPWRELYPDWSPDGRRIVFQSDADLAIMDCDGGNVQTLNTGEIRFHQTPLWSPDGTKIVFSSHVGAVGNGTPDIFIFDLATETVLNLTRHPRNDEWPSWSPDGRWIAFASNRDPKFWLPFPGAPLGFALTDDIYIMDSEGNQLKNLTETQAEEKLPIWSPDGTEIAFIRSVGGFNAELYLMTVDGKRERRLDFAPSIASISWSPDGTQLLLTGVTAEGWDIYIMNRDGSNVRNLTADFDRRAAFPRMFQPGLGVSPVGLKQTLWGEVKQSEK